MHAVVTLVEKDFLYGAAVLYNSLIKKGFKGIFFIGFRNYKAMPQRLLWCMKRIPTSFPRIEWNELNTEWHFTNYKPRFMLDLFKQYPQLTKITYFDPDIVFSGCPWNCLENASNHGPVICGDVNWMLPQGHPIRYEWSELIKKSGFITNSVGDIYFNGGLLSLKRDDISFLERWQKFIEIAGTLGNPLSAHGDVGHNGNRTNPFYVLDQDALNMAAMAWGGKLSVFGPDAMGFLPGNRMALHAVGVDKPWRLMHWNSIFSAGPPRLVDKKFWSNVSQPIKVFSKHRILFSRTMLLIAAFVSRFYCKK